MAGLPKLPGLSFENVRKQNHHVTHMLDMRNGHLLPKTTACHIGKSVAEIPEISDTLLFDPTLTYGRVKHPPVQPFRPHFVLYDKIALTFFAFFKEGIPESATEHYRIRHVNIIYFMDDHSITVMEPCVKNAGYKTGRLVRRGKIPKNTRGEVYTWKDFNIGIDMEFYGIVYHITRCDKYTKEFMLSQGIELNEEESTPMDPVTAERRINQSLKCRLTPQVDDKLRRYLEFQGKVLQFDCVLDETDQPFGECLTYKLFYFLEDDTVSIKELKENAEGRDRFPMLLRRRKLPKNYKRQPVAFPSIYLEVTDAEVDEYYQPRDFKLGDTIFVFGRRFLLLDCDKFTRKYFDEVLKEGQGPKREIQFPHKAPAVRDIPDYIGFGSPEDSLASCYGLVPKAPKMDVITYLVNMNKKLRYECVLDTAHPEDAIRKFILTYNLPDGKIKIDEPVIRNSGILGGKFLANQLVWRPNCNPNKPEYYTPKDLYIGATLIINAHRFLVTNADLYVYRYMLQHPELFTKETIETVKNCHVVNGKLTAEIQAAIDEDCKRLEDHDQTKAPHDPVSTYEECLKRVHIVENDKTSGIPVQSGFLDTERKENYSASGDLTECAYNVRIAEPGSFGYKDMIGKDDRAAMNCELTKLNSENGKTVRFHEDHN